MIILGIILIILQIVDIITTNVGIKNGCIEGNPIMKKITKTKVPIWLIVSKISLGAFVMWTLSFNIRILIWIIGALDIFMVAVVLLNLMSIYIQKRFGNDYRYYKNSRCRSD